MCEILVVGGLVCGRLNMVCVVKERKKYASGSRHIDRVTLPRSFRHIGSLTSFQIESLGKHETAAMSIDTIGIPLKAHISVCLPRGCVIKTLL